MQKKDQNYTQLNDTEQLDNLFYKCRFIILR